MDLGTVAENLKSGRYPTLEAFKSDVRLTFENAMTYNEHDTVVHNIAKRFLSLLGMDNEEVQGSVPKVATQRPESSIPSINNDLMEKQEHEPMVSTHSFDTSSNEPLGMTVDFGETCVIVTFGWHETMLLFTPAVRELRFQETTAVVGLIE